MDKSLTVLITGGAGYIGSHFVHLLNRTTDYRILVVENFSQGRKNILKSDRIIYDKVDLREREKLAEVLKRGRPDIVVHFAALATITASVTGPSPTYENNVVGGWNLLDAMLGADVKKIIYSSSGSVYGEPQNEFMDEDHPLNPINPYGYTKLFFERLLRDYHQPYKLDSISFRYFNPCGANNSLEVGEYHDPETHVIPCIVETLLGRRKEFLVYGNDYPTPDGTCIRDYIHVEDLVRAHLSAMQKLMGKNGVCEAYNLGTNKGTSVMELIASAERVTGQKLNYKIASRRPGDPSRSIANASKVMKELNWKPKYYNIDDMVKSCYESFKNRK